jgi:arylformamidase
MVWGWRLPKQDSFVLQANRARTIMNKIQVLSIFNKLDANFPRPVACLITDIHTFIENFEIPSMEFTLVIDSEEYTVDLSSPHDLSIPLKNGTDNPSAWYVGPVKITAVEGDGFVGDVNRGGSVNFRDIYFNPHGHGTHTECVGHISSENYTINQCHNDPFYCALVITVTPEVIENGDQVIFASHLQPWIHELTMVKALIIRTLPNDQSKLNRNYSNSNPPYIHYGATQQMVKAGIRHLLVDLPSVDREKDDGKLEAHHSFWQYPNKTRMNATITEFIYVPDEVKDGYYFLNLQIASFENDASPSKPVIYPIQKVQK